MTLATTVKGFIFPVVFTASLAVFGALLTVQTEPGIALLAMTALNLATVAILEQHAPFRREWAWWSDRQTINDLLHGALLSYLGPRIGEALLSSVVVTGVAELAPAGGGLWPAQAPLAAQIVLAIFVTDFLDAAKHWAYHKVSFLWPIHALHHAVDRLHVAKGARLHFLESTVRYGVITLPLIAFGAGPDVIYWYAAVMNALGNLNHSNIDMPLPRPLHYLIATPQVHRLHHSIDNELGSSNLSPGFMFPDHLFGTFRDPVSRPLGEVGIADDPIPPDFLSQILSPALWPILTWRRRRSAESARSCDAAHRAKTSKDRSQ